MRISRRFRAIVVGVCAVLLAACSTETIESTAPVAVERTGGRVAASSIGNEPITNMTWEGCQLTPGCVPGEAPTLGQIHDGNTSTQLFDAGTPDPSPSAAGIYVGLGATDCYANRASSTTGWFDLDEDGLRDLCEYRLATAFAPMLFASPNDGCLEGEPYWMAKFIDDSPYGTGDMVKLAYLRSYYEDCGSLGHHGDSELIQLTVVYNYSTQHWELVNSWLSEHACEDYSLS